MAPAQLVVVTGKGGVGRTHVAAAIAVGAARRGLRACAVELSGESSLAASLGLNGRAYQPRPGAEGVDVRSLTPLECLSDFGRRKLKLGSLGSLVLENRLIGAFVDSLPGLHDMLQLGKLENQINEPLAGEPQWDVVVLDAPATGHGLSLLASARAMREMTRVGPFFELARIIEDLLVDPLRCGVVVTTLAEELPAHETVELTAALRAEGLQVRGIVANRVAELAWPSGASWRDVAPPLASALGAEHALLRFAAAAAHRAEQEAEQVAWLRDRLPDLPVAVVPALPAPTPSAMAEYVPRSVWEAR